MLKAETWRKQTRIFTARRAVYAMALCTGVDKGASPHPAAQRPGKKDFFVKIGDFQVSRDLSLSPQT